MFQTDHFLRPPERQNTAGRLIEHFVLCFFGFVNVIILYQFIFKRSESWHVLTAVYLIIVILTCGIIIRIQARPSYVLLVVLSLSLVVRLLYVAAVPTEPVSDFKGLYEAAQASSMGDFSWSHVSEGYFYFWGYQIPFVLYESIIFRLFHSILMLKLFNIFFMVGINYLLYRIGQFFLSDKAALCVAFIYAVFPGAVMYTSVLTNQHISLFFLLLGVLFFLRSKQWWGLLISGVILAISDLMRPETIVILAAIICCGLLRYVQHPNIESIKRLAITVILMVGCYWMTKKLVELALIWMDIAPNGIGNRMPEWKFVLGLGNIEGYGSYSEEHISIFSIKDDSARRVMVAGIINELFRRPPLEIIRFFIGKIRYFWTDPQALKWSFRNVEDSMLILPGVTAYAFQVYFQYLERGMLLLVYLLTLPVPILLWKEKKTNGAELFCIATVCVMFCVYLFVEVQPRYRYFAIPFWLLIGGMTLEWLIQYWSHRLQDLAKTEDNRIESK